MDDRLEATFVVGVSPSEAWAAFRADGDRVWLPGFDSLGTPLEVEPERRLRVRKDEMPCAGTEIVVTLEAAASGTRITVVQSGFGPIFDAMEGSLRVGWAQILADLVLYLERGVQGGRHTRPWAWAGCVVVPVPAGLEIVNVAEGAYADRVGIEAGDLLLTLGGAPVLHEADLAAVMRVFAAGDKLEATWVHGRELRSATAIL